MAKAVAAPKPTHKTKTLFVILTGAAADAAEAAEAAETA